MGGKGGHGRPFFGRTARTGFDLGENRKGRVTDDSAITENGFSVDPY